MNRSPQARDPGYWRPKPVGWTLFGIAYAAVAAVILTVLLITGSEP